MTPTRAFVYVATGAGYVAEAQRSAESLRRHHAAVPIVLLTDAAPATSAPFDQIIVRTDARHNPSDKLWAIDAPFDEIVFLDTDTFICGRIDELFQLLATHDLAALQENHRGWDYELPGVPACYPEFNTGVLVFRRTEPVRQLFATWRDAYDQLRAAQNLKNDQPAFRLALHRSGLRVAALPSEFHFLANVPNYTMWEVRLLHGRGDLPAIAREVNARPGPRAYVPHLGVLHGYVGRAAWARTLARVAWRLVKTLFRPPADASAANPGRWWL